MAQDRAKDNDFKQLFLEMYPRLVRYAVSLLGDGNEARDVVGDVFEKAWNQFSSLQMETRSDMFFTFGYHIECKTEASKGKKQKIISFMGYK